MSYEPSLSVERHAGFYYTEAGILDKDSSPLEHLAIGLAHNVVANGHRKSLESGTIVVNYAKHNEKYYAQVGIATGKISAFGPDNYWSGWKNKKSLVFEVVWVTKIVPVPAEFFVTQRQSLALTIVEQVANYVLRHNK